MVGTGLCFGDHFSTSTLPGSELALDDAFSLFAAAESGADLEILEIRSADGWMVNADLK